MASATGVLATLGRGSHDDGGEGIVRVKTDQGVMVPLPIGRSRAVAQGGAGQTSFAISPHRSNVLAWSNLGITGGAVTNLPAATIGVSGITQIPRLMGRRLGLVVLMSAAGGGTQMTTAVPMDVFVNGELYFNGDTYSRLNGIAAGGDVWYLPICDDLPDDGPHSMEICQWPDASAATSIQLIAVLVEERFGYQLTHQYGNDEAALTLSTTATGIGTSAQSIVRHIRYANTDTAAHTVQILDQSNNVVAAIALAAATGSGASLVPGIGEFDPKIPVVLNNWKHQIEATPGTGAVLAWSISTQ